MMVAGTKSNEIEKNIWLGDTGSSAHMTNSLEGMFDLQKIQDKVRIGGGKFMHTVAVGSKHVLVIQKNGEMAAVTLKNVKYVPDLWTNLFSITAAMSHGFKVSSEQNIL